MIEDNVVKRADGKTLLYKVKLLRREDVQREGKLETYLNYIVNWVDYSD